VLHRQAKGAAGLSSQWTSALAEFCQGAVSSNFGYAGRSYRRTLFSDLGSFPTFTVFVPK
jgi:hypothetical protein